MEHLSNFYNTILKSSHPILLGLHLAGKAAPIVFYIIGSLFLGFTAQFICVVLLLAFDFYLTKNISGRKLVQLRWWYDSTTENTETFRFESYKQYPPSLGPPINPIDSRLFWWSMYATPIVWAVFGILCILRLKLFYLVLVVVAVFLTGWNTYGFRCCDKWDPIAKNADNSTESWFQLPSIPGLDNLQRMARFQSFFQGQSS
ncbi:hypothetical protein NCAS_0B04100 [Naumovozyma castellii]|uniref:Golgi apparatus membrane protein TVP23 n=1 Tax=Naumovozyma castellii TaxID=27288 RepID=G0VA09_NAUCA|nr:hypothetical protein NCAS_0B04100 [Naumovozyma castellii CBS 4309]CCC68494.1 hypothetical protein NCAS_0B04100 [Naumovozyma castellii CBS 4309]